MMSIEMATFLLGLTIFFRNGNKSLINDDPKLAKKLNADGCHLGQKDISLTEVLKKYFQPTETKVLCSANT